MTRLTRFFPHMQQDSEFAVPQGIITFMLGFDGNCHGFILPGLPRFPIKARAMKGDTNPSSKRPHKMSREPFSQRLY